MEVEYYIGVDFYSCQNSILHRPKILKSSLGCDCGLLGAAALCFNINREK